MDLFEAIEKRRSIRKFTSEPFPDESVKKAIEAAILAPNSSNTQTWDFHWIKNSDLKQKLILACMNQSAARTANQFIVVTANPKNWRRSLPPLIRYVESVNAPRLVQVYYRKLVPFTYSWGIFNTFALFKWFVTTCVGFFRPVVRGPYSKRDLQEVAVKSAALASENLMLAITALGGASCPMEGFDDWKVRRLLKLSCSAKIVMVLGIGFEGPRGTWGPRFRIPFEDVVHIYQ